MKYDVIIPCAGRDIQFVPRVVKYIRICLLDVDSIYIITNNRFFKPLRKYLNKYNCQCSVLDENDLVEGLTFSNVAELLNNQKEGLSTGWYFQQFLKYGFALTNKANKYYLTWDADTLPLSQISFFEEDHPLFTAKYEYNPNYFKTIKKLIGLNKVNDYSFIAEHMMFNPQLVKELIEVIESSAVKGKNWMEKIINAGDYDDPMPTFSEFETYGTFVSQRYPDLYRTRRLNTFRCGGYIEGRNISDKKLKTISFDCDTISFEIRHMPSFPNNIICRAQYYYFVLFVLKQYSIKDVLNRLYKLLSRHKRVEETTHQTRL